VREPDDFNEAFAVMDREPPDAILMVSDSLTVLNRKRVFDYAAAHRLPAIYEYDPLVREGGLMSYGPDLRESFERAASMVDRIFKGAKPADLPFEQPTRYLFVLNLETAKSKFRRRCWRWPTRWSNEACNFRCWHLTGPLRAKSGRAEIVIG
jgi:putative tryptophan/tyrosine transport system substrate-binding protein